MQQDETRALTEEEQSELRAYAARLSRLPSADLATELAYHADMLEQFGQSLLQEEADDATPEFLGYRVTEHRRQREVCEQELERRTRVGSLPRRGAIGTAQRPRGIDPALIREIKARLDLPELIERYGVPLKRRGRAWKGLCPFHADRNPSLSVSPEKGLWHCFGCGAGGDAITFVMRRDGQDFMSALRELAAQAGIELPIGRDGFPLAEFTLSPSFLRVNSANVLGVARRAGRAVLAPADDAWLPAQEVLRALARGETGDAELFARLFDERVRYDHSEKMWYLWRGSHWERDRVSAVNLLVANETASQYLHAAAEQRAGGEDAEPVKALQERANLLRYKNKIANVLTLASSQPALALTGDEWDADPLVLGVANGVIDLRRGEWRAGHPRDYIRTAAPTEWRGLDEAAPRWERFLQEIFAGDAALIAFAQRLCGYAITGLTSEHLFPVLWGEGRNGKDTLLETLAFVLGHGLAGPVSADLLLEAESQPHAPTPHLYFLRGRRLCWANESKEGARLNASRIKALTGGGTLVARPLYGSPVTFQPHYVLMLMTNHKPHANADDYALWQRLLLLPFTQAFVEQAKAPNEHPRDASLRLKLQAEASGILAWLVRGCLDWQRQGLNAPEAVRAATGAYQEEEDIVSQFIRERCRVQSDAHAQAGDLYAAYHDWAQSNGLTPMSGTAFGRRMAKKFHRQIGARNIYLGVGLTV